MSGGRGFGRRGDGGNVAIQATINPGTGGISVAAGSVGDAAQDGLITFAQPTLTPTKVDLTAPPAP